MEALIDEFNLGVGYPDLAGQFGWTLGVHRAPVGYQHPWLVVTHGRTVGAWSRRQAWAVWQAVRNA